jgi:hypothetical protein
VATPASMTVRGWKPRLESWCKAPFMLARADVADLRRSSRPKAAKRRLINMPGGVAHGRATSGEEKSPPSETVRGAASVEKNAADEKTGEDEEEIDTAPAGGESGEKSMWPETQWGVVGIADVMTKYDEQDGEAAEAVELGDADGKAERAGARLCRQRRTPCD